MNIVISLAVGLALGIVTGMPLGVVNVAIVDAASAGHRRFATGVGIGGALADLVHASLAFVGVGRLITARPELVRILAAASAALIVAYAMVAWRRRTPARPAIDATGARSVLTGLLLTLPNPGALSAWVAVAAALWPDATIAEAIALGAGVGVGSAAWFALLAYLVGRVPREHRALQIIPRVAVVALVGIAIAGVLRVL